MLSNVLWGLFLVLFVILMIYIDKRKKNKRKGQPPIRKGGTGKESRTGGGSGKRLAEWATDGRRWLIRKNVRPYRSARFSVGHIFSGGLCVTYVPAIKS